MALSSAYLAELKKGQNQPCTVIEVALDAGTRKYGTHRMYADVTACVVSSTSVQNKIDTKSGHSTRGKITFTLAGREIIKDLVKNHYLKNRRITIKQGFITSTFVYADYATVFTGLITDWTRKGDELVISAQDELYEADTVLPTEFSTSLTAYTSGTHYIDYRNMNPVDVMLAIFTKLGISGTYINTAQFESERDLWLSGVKVNRILTDPDKANELLNELQEETNSFIIHDGQKITFKVFAPTIPSASIETWTDDNQILEGSMSVKSGYDGNFYNRVVVYFDYKEEGGDDSTSYESAYIVSDSTSQGSAVWDEVSTKTIYSKWLRTLTWSQTSNVTGVVITHVSASNGIGSGTLTYDYSSQTLQWTAPSGTIGEAVEVSEIGDLTLYDTDKTKYVRVLVTELASLSGTDETDTIALTAANGLAYATALANRLIARYKNPAASISFEVGLNNAAYDSEFVKPTDQKYITTDEAFEKGEDTWAAEPIMLTSVRPNDKKHTISIEAIESKMYNKYGFIAPAGYPDYGSATADQKKRAFIGAASTNYVGSSEQGYSIW